MKRIAVVPKIFRDNATLSDRVLQFFLHLEKLLGFEILYANHLPAQASRADLVLIYAGAHGRNTLRQSTMLAKGIKVAYLLTGPHNFTAAILGPVFDRADLALCTYGEYMRQNFPQFNRRWHFFPLYFAPDARYTSLPIRKNPLERALFTGHTNKTLYPIRADILRQLPHQKERFIDRLLHPRWERRDPMAHYEIAPAVNEVYAKLLNRYRCSIATASIYRYGLAKYFEIPAAGTLMLAERTRDALQAGLRAGEHYVPISAKNALAQVKKCCTEPELFEHIRQQATAFVRANHSVDNRVVELKEHLDEL